MHLEVLSASLLPARLTTALYPTTTTSAPGVGHSSTTNYTSLLASSSQWSLMAAPPDAMMDPSMMQNGLATSCLLAQPTLVEQSRMHHHEYMQRCLENGNGGLISQPTLTSQASIPLSSVACNLPMLLSTSTDRAVLTKFQVFLRLHIEVFAATDKDVTSHIRGRHKKVLLNQVGIRCRHCAHIPPNQRLRGSVYFPSSTMGFYQASQNMCTTHLQCGLCPEMPESIKTEFAQLIGTKTASSSSVGGRAYWGRCAQQMGLVDTEQGIFAVGII
jgi:hypothetical protein